MQYTVDFFTSTMLLLCDAYLIFFEIKLRVLLYMLPFYYSKTKNSIATVFFFLTLVLR